MEYFFEGLSKGITTFALGITSLLPFASHTQIQPVVTQEHVTVSPQETIAIKKTITAMGMNITIDMTTPKNGGPLTGKISGDCNGTITGNYAGPSQKDFTGTGAISCPLGILTVDGNVVFKGILDQDTRQATIHYDATTTTGMSKSGTIAVSF